MKMSLNDLLERFQENYTTMLSHFYYSNGVQGESLKTLNSFEDHVIWLADFLSKSSVSRSFLSNNVVVSLCQSDEEDWHELPQGIEVFFDVPIEVMQEAIDKVKFVLSEFNDLVEKKKYKSSRIVHLLNDVIEESNDTVKALRLALG